MQDLQRGFTNKQDMLESVNARGTSLVDVCEDQLSRESGRTKLSDLNETWGECLGTLSDREEMLKRALELAEKYEVCTYMLVCKTHPSNITAYIYTVWN